MSYQGADENVRRIVFSIEGDYRFRVRPNTVLGHGDDNYVVHRIEVYPEFIRVVGSYGGHLNPERDLGTFDNYLLSLYAPSTIMEEIRLAQERLSMATNAAST